MAQLGNVHRWELRLLGIVELRAVTTQDCVPVPPKVMALLAYLTLSCQHGPVRRDTLTGLFWPKLSHQNARTALRQELYALKEILGDGVVETMGREQIGLRSGALWCDAVEFNGACRCGDLDRATTLYRGPLANGLYLSGAPEFERWLEAERRNASDNYEQAVEAVATALEKTGDREAAVKWWRRLVVNDPYQSQHVGKLMEALANAGDPANALQCLADHERLLREDLDVAPDDSLFALRDRISRQSRSDVRHPVPNSVVPAPVIEVKAGRHWLRWRALRGPLFAGLAASAVIAVAVSQPWTRGTRALNSTSRAHVVLTDVEGLADQELGQIVRTLIAAELDQSSNLLTLPDGQVARALQASMLPDSTQITLSVAREIAIRGGLSTVVCPTVSRIGDSYLIVLQAINVTRDSVSASSQATAQDEQDLISAVERAVRQLAQGLGVERNRMVDPFYWAGMTPSFEAFAKYRQALTLNQLGQYDESMQAARDALELDPAFAHAWWVLGITLYNSGRRDSAIQALSSAAGHPERLQESGRLWVEGHLAWARRDWSTALRLRETLVRQFGQGHNNYALSLARLGYIEDAVALWEERNQTLPFGLDDLEAYNLAENLIALGRLERATLLVNRLPGRRAKEIEVKIASAGGSWWLVDSLARDVLSDVTLTEWYLRCALGCLASSTAARGSVSDARSALTQWIRSAVESGAEPYDGVEALLTLSLVSGERSDSRELRLLESDDGERSRRLLALGALYGGDTAVALRHIEALPGLERQTFRRFDGDESQLVLVHASMAAARNDWEGAIRLLREIVGRRRWRGWEPLVNQSAYWTIANAFERVGRPDSASAYFAQLASAEILARDRVWRGLTHSFSHRRAAQLYTLMGQSDLAREHWIAFLESFSDPDPEYQWMREHALAELDGLESRAR